MRAFLVTLWGRSVTTAQLIRGAKHQTGVRFVSEHNPVDEAFAFAITLVTYVFGVWLLLLSPPFRRRVLRCWGRRKGWSHIRTLAEIVIAVAFGVVPLAVAVFSVLPL